MTPAARLAAAIEVFAAIESRHRPVSEALKDWGAAHRFAGSGDRAAIGNLAYDALRWRASTAWVMGEESPRALVLGTVARRWGLGVDGLAALIAGDAHAPEPLSAVEAERIAGADLAAAPDHVRADVPEWVAPRFERVFGADWVAEGEALALRPPLDLRANRLKADRDKVLKALARFGAAETAFSPDGVRIAPTEAGERHPNVTVEPGFQKGWFEVQDEGSQIAALIVGAKPGEHVLDFCAGAGGKTLALAAAMENKGQVYATDSDRSRLAPIFERLRRAGTRNVQVRDAGASLDDLVGRIDAVLIDAPCTGTGVWRRRPDAKWRLTEKAVGERVAEQSALLAAATRYLKPGGRLVYVTCSILPEENSEQVAAFAAGRPEFALLPVKDALAGAALPEAARARLAERTFLAPGGVVLSPRRTGTDGFFVAVLRRS
jgi:16S rRNA (cytosine967-C5)-methyltransferase